MATSTQDNETDMGYGTIFLFFFTWMAWFVGRLGEALARHQIDKLYNYTPPPEALVKIIVDEDGRIHRGIN